jgi:hypothetical protein
MVEILMADCTGPQDHDRTFFAGSGVGAARVKTLAPRSKFEPALVFVHRRLL